jgi:hypothetical protein
MSDDHDADAISAYNKKFISTPNMDRIAREGMRFTNCFVGNSIWSPARAISNDHDRQMASSLPTGLITGQYCPARGLLFNPSDQYE